MHITDTDFDKALADKIVPQIDRQRTELSSTDNQMFQLNKESTGMLVGADMCSPPKPFSTPSRSATTSL